MRLLFLTNVYPSPDQPGKGNFNHQLVRALASRHDVRVVVPVTVGECRRATFRRCIRRELDGISLWYPTYYYTPRTFRHWYGTFMWHSIRSTLRHVTHAWRPDAVVSYWAHPDGEVGNRWARRLGIPSVVIVGGTDVHTLMDHPKRGRYVLRVLQQADAVLTVGQHLRTRLVRAGISPGKVHAFYRGVDADRFCPGSRDVARDRLGLPKDEASLLWVGRMVPVKGVHLLINACHTLRAQGSDPVLYLVGEGPLRSALTDQVQRVGLQGRVRMVGSVAHNLLPDWYRAADRTVLPSFAEGVPNVLLESHACGTPFVASDVGGVGEIAEQPWDRLVAPGCATALAAELRAALCAPQVTPPGFRRRYSWNDAVEAIEAAINPLSIEPTLSSGTATVPNRNSHIGREVHEHEYAR